MLEFSTNQTVILLLTLVLGLLLGGLLRSGSGRWRHAYEREHQARLELERVHEARYSAANTRIAELERQAGPIGAGTAASIAAGASGRRDDLSRIQGIGRTGETRLNDAGVHRYADLERLTPEDEAALEGRLGLEPGTIEREQWRDQAELLHKGKVEEHRSRFG